MGRMGPETRGCSRVAHGAHTDTPTASPPAGRGHPTAGTPRPRELPCMRRDANGSKPTCAGPPGRRPAVPGPRGIEAAGGLAAALAGRRPASRDEVLARLRSARDQLAAALGGSTRRRPARPARRSCGGGRTGRRRSRRPDLPRDGPRKAPPRPVAAPPARGRGSSSRPPRGPWRGSWAFLDASRVSPPRADRAGAGSGRRGGRPGASS